MNRPGGHQQAPSGSGARPAGRTVLLVGNYLPSLAVARGLAAAGYRVIAGDGGEYSTVRHSRHCQEVWRHPPVSDSEAFIAALTAFLARRAEITTILPLREHYVAALARARDRLPEGVVVAAPDPGVVLACVDKVRLHGIAREARVPCRPIAVARDAESARAAADEVGYPCVVRPADHGTRLPGEVKALICRDRVALDQALEGWTVPRGLLLVQQYVAGPRHNVYFIARSGRALARLETRVERTDRLDGTGVAVEEAVVSPDPRLVRSCDALVERLSYTGVGCVQFIVPVGGEPSLLEVNPRHDASAAGVEACGLPLTLAAMELASGDAGWRPDPAYRHPVGLRFAWTSRDLYGLGMAISRREVGARTALRWMAGALRAAARARVHLTWTWRDPMPTLAVYAHLATLGPWRAQRGRGPASPSPGTDGAGGALGAQPHGMPGAGGRGDR
jgi:biotin carboxylase